MPDFENYSGTAANIALQIERKLIALGIDWRDEAALKSLAKEALEYDKATTFPGLDGAGEEQLVRMELCGLIALMFHTMTEGATDGQYIHGTEVWKALGRAMWAVKGPADSPNGST